MQRLFRNIHATLIATLALAACAKKSADATGQAPRPAISEEPSHDDSPRWKDPPTWKKRAPSNRMRLAEYTIPHGTKDAEDAECVVTTFGAGQGGGVDANIERWVRQFDPKDATVVRKETKSIGGMQVTTVEITGTYTAMQMPGAKEKPVPKPETRMIASVIEAKKQPYFFKLVGPSDTVRDAAPAYDEMIASLVQ